MRVLNAMLSSRPSLAWTQFHFQFQDASKHLFRTQDAAAAIKRFKAKFKDKTKNTWEVYKEGKFERKQYGGRCLLAISFAWSAT
eukprot:SAG11_NODE_682_length_7769_cov_45.167275_8_plen_84_part_00